MARFLSVGAYLLVEVLCGVGVSFSFGLLCIVRGVFMKVIRLKFPEHLELSEDEVRLLVAVELYREGKLTLKQAAELADLCVEDFIKELSRREVSVVN